MDKPYRDMAELSHALLDIPELLEIVFSSTRNADLMVFRHVCRQMRSVIDESPPLQRKLFRLPDFTGKPKAVGWIVSNVGKDFAFIGNNKTFKLDLHGFPFFETQRPTRRICKVDPYYHDMYLVQPPIKSVDWMNYRCDGSKILELSCKTGLTLGHLIEIFRRDIQDHSCSRIKKECCFITSCNGRFKGRAAVENFVRKGEHESSNGQANLVLTEFSDKKWSRFT